MKRLLPALLIAAMLAGCSGNDRIEAAYWADRTEVAQTSATNVASWTQVAELSANATQHAGVIKTMAAPYMPQAGRVQMSAPVRIDIVIDGDSFWGMDGVEYRLAGIDAPELSEGPFNDDNVGDIAATFFEGEEEECGDDLSVEYGEKARTDEYGRTLVYLWCTTTGTLINEALVRAGVARERYYGDNDKYRSRYLAAQADAQARRMWIWETGVLCGPPNCTWR